MRTRRFFRLAFLLTASRLAAALAPLRQEALTIDVQQESYDSISTRWKMDWGSAGKDYLRRRVLIVSLRTVGEADRNVILEWYFVGQYTDGGGGLALYGGGAAPCQTGANKGKPFVIGSDFVGAYHDRYVALGLTERGGVKPFGWVVLVWQGNRLVKARGSVPELARDFSQSLIALGAPKIRSRG